MQHLRRECDDAIVDINLIEDFKRVYVNISKF